jgi:hypothetical protein
MSRHHMAGSNSLAGSILFAKDSLFERTKCLPPLPQFFEHCIPSLPIETATAILARVYEFRGGRRLRHER